MSGTVPPPGGDHGLKGLEGKMGGKKNLLLLGAVATAGLAFMMSRKKNAAAATTGTTTTDQTLYDGSTVDAMNGMQSEIDALQNRIATGTASPGTPPVTTLPAGKPPAPSPKPKPPPPKPKPKPKPIHKPPVHHKPPPKKRGK